METNVIWRNARAAVIELDDGGYFTCADTWEIFVNDEPAGTTNTVETYVDGLTPGKRNLVRFVCGERELSVGVTTPAEPFTINVRDCGAKGDAEHDDTTNIQAAIMACPKGGRVLIPAGSYRIKSLFLKSNINIELAEGAVLLARHDRAALAYIPGTVTGNEGAGYAGTDMLPLGRWEGESFSTYCSTFTGLGVHDVCIYGRGAIDGQTDFAEDNWWNKDFKNIFRPEEGREVARPRMIFLSECQNVSLAGFIVRNSPAWNIHPVLCEHVDALCLSIEGPKNSHNTDGFDPESCGFVRILGCQFSVGDDCIAIKSGKLGIEPELRPATHDVLISHCYMHDGHGAVVLGSEAAGGIKDLTVSKCLFVSAPTAACASRPAAGAARMPSTRALPLSTFVWTRYSRPSWSTPSTSVTRTARPITCSLARRCLSTTARPALVPRRFAISRPPTAMLPRPISRVCPRAR